MSSFLEILQQPCFGNKVIGRVSDFAIPSRIRSSAFSQEIPSALDLITHKLAGFLLNNDHMMLSYLSLFALLETSNCIKNLSLGRAFKIEPIL